MYYKKKKKNNKKKSSFFVINLYITIYQEYTKQKSLHKFHLKAQ